VATGLASGLLGVGGGFVMEPALVMLGTPQREANGTSLAVILPVAIVGASILGQGHQVDLKVGIALAIGSVGGAVIGARLTRRLSDLVLRRAGTVAGVLSGQLGIRGGAVMVPAMTLLMGLSQHVAQGTSLLVIIPTAISGSITHFRMGNIQIKTAGWLSVGGVLGAVAGAVVALARPDQLLRLLFGASSASRGFACCKRRGRKSCSLQWRVDEPGRLVGHHHGGLDARHDRHRPGDGAASRRRRPRVRHAAGGTPPATADRWGDAAPGLGISATGPPLSL